MNTRACCRPAPARQALLAKLMIGISTVVALATSPPEGEGTPGWRRELEQSRQVVLIEAREQKLLVTIELAGELYADARQGNLTLVAVTDRAASDFSLGAVPLLPLGSAALGPDGGVVQEIARPATSQPTRAALGFSLACANIPVGDRAAACVEQFEVTLARESERALTADLTLAVVLTGSHEDEPPGTFNVTLEEVPE